MGLGVTWLSMPEYKNVHVLISLTMNGVRSCVLFLVSLNDMYKILHYKVHTCT